MLTIAATGRVKSDGTLDLHVRTGLAETDVEVLLVLAPLKPGWPEGYFTRTFGSLRDNPIGREELPDLEAREDLH